MDLTLLNIKRNIYGHLQSSDAFDACQNMIPRIER